jgi:alkylhydroperoxidase family enzyme
MRLTPIDRPPTLLARLMFAALRRMFGQVPTPYRVIFARFPQALFAQALIALTLDRRMTIDRGLKYLLQSHVAGLNGCDFCVDIARAVAIQQHIDPAKLVIGPEWRTDPRYDARERAALAYAEESTRDRTVTDATFDRLRAQFSEAEIIQITWLCAVENYFNRLNLPLGIGADGLCALPTRSS